MMVLFDVIYTYIYMTLSLQIFIDKLFTFITYSNIICIYFKNCQKYTVALF